MDGEQQQVCMTTWADDAALDGAALDDGAFVADIRSALAAGHIYLAYQPIVELGSGRLQKVEALARWTHPTRGPISPWEFISRSEQTGVIDELGAWILERACTEIVALRDQGLDIDLNVNFSVVQLRDPAIAERTAKILARSGLAPERVSIELTESVFLEDQATGPLMQLRDLGLHLVIDDFGTGFSNFQYISRLPISGLKLDRSFVAGLGVNGSDSAIVRSITNLCRELGLQIVAEGVETESQRSQLQSYNCRLAQGWLFAPALRPEELVAQFGPTVTGVEFPDRVRSIDEAARIAALRACKVLDTAPEQAFDALAQMASKLLDTPMALISLVDTDRQWFKASVGLDVEETSREIAFCSHAIADLYPPFVIADASRDERFVENPLVVEAPHIRSYAGAPIRSREDLPLGTLCVLDTRPREFSAQHLEQLTGLAEQAAALLDLRRRAEELNVLLRTRTTIAPSHVAREIQTTDSNREVSGLAAPTSEPCRRIQCDALAIDTVDRRVVLNDSEIDTTSKEFDLITFLVEHFGGAFTGSELLDQLWRAAPGWQSPASHAPTRQPRFGSGIQIGTRIVAIDSGALALFAAKDPAEVIGRDIFDFVAPASRPAARSRREIRTAGHSPGDQLIMIRGLDGTELMVRMTTEIFELAGDAAVRVTMHEMLGHRLGLLPDIRVEAEYDSHDAVIVTDADFHILSWSPGAERLYGWLAHEVIGHSLNNVVPVHAYVEDTAAANGVEAQWGSAARFSARDGTIVSARVSTRPICGPDGSVDGMLFAHRPYREDSSDVALMAGFLGTRC